MPGINPNYFGPITIQTPGKDKLTVGDAVHEALIATDAGKFFDFNRSWTD